MKQALRPTLRARQSRERKGRPRKELIAPQVSASVDGHSARRREVAGEARGPGAGTLVADPGSDGGARPARYPCERDRSQPAAVARWVSFNRWWCGRVTGDTSWWPGSGG